MSCSAQVYVILCKNMFSIVRLGLSLKWIVREQKINIIWPRGASIFICYRFESFWVFLCFIIFRVTMRLCRNDNFLISFQGAPHGNSRLLWIVCEVLREYQPERIPNFREIIFFHKRNAHVMFHHGSQFRHSVSIYELIENSTSYLRKSTIPRSGANPFLRVNSCHFALGMCTS